MYVQIALSAYEGPKTDDCKQLSGEQAHAINLDRVMEFEVVTSAFSRIHANGAFWERHRNDIMQAIAEILYDGRVEAYKLPLDTELFKWNPHSKELTLDYTIRCKKCSDGMSEYGEKGLCSVCDG